MNHTVHTAYVLDRQRAAQLDRSNELRRQHAERRACREVAPHPSVAANLVRRITTLVRRSTPAKVGAL